MELNSQSLSPYNLIPITDSDGDFVGYEFITDHTIQYRITFTQSTIYDELSFGDFCYQTTIAPVVEGNENPYHAQVPKDQKVGQTVGHALDCFFLEKRNVVLYVCYEDDERKDMRERKFNAWHQLYMAKNIMKYNVHPEPEVDIAVLYRFDNPYRDAIEATF